MVSAGTIVFEQSRWGFEFFRWDDIPRRHTLEALALICLVLGAVVVRQEKYRVWSIAVVVLGLLVGQYWALQDALFWLTWR